MIILLLSLLFSGLLASLIHLFLGDGVDELLRFWGLGLIGFLAGHWLGANNVAFLPTLGTVHILPACLGCITGVLVANVFKL